MRSKSRLSMQPPCDPAVCAGVTGMVYTFAASIILYLGISGLECHTISSSFGVLPSMLLYFEGNRGRSGVRSATCSIILHMPMPRWISQHPKLAATTKAPRNGVAARERSLLRAFSLH